MILKNLTHCERIAVDVKHIIVMIIIIMYYILI